MVGIATSTAFLHAAEDPDEVVVDLEQRRRRRCSWRWASAKGFSCSRLYAAQDPEGDLRPARACRRASARRRAGAGSVPGAEHLAARAAARDPEAVRAGQQVAQPREHAEEAAVAVVEEDVEAGGGHDLRGPCRRRRGPIWTPSTAGSVVGRLERLAVERRACRSSVPAGRRSPSDPGHAQRLRRRAAAIVTSPVPIAADDREPWRTVTLTGPAGPTRARGRRGWTVAVAARLFAGAVRRQRQPPRRDVADREASGRPARRPSESAPKAIAVWEAATSASRARADVDGRRSQPLSASLRLPGRSRRAGCARSARGEPRPYLREHRGGAGDGGCRDARAVHGRERGLAVGGGARVGGGDADRRARTGPARGSRRRRGPATRTARPGRNRRSALVSAVPTAAPTSTPRRISATRPLPKGGGTPTTGTPMSPAEPSEPAGRHLAVEEHDRWRRPWPPQPPSRSDRHPAERARRARRRRCGPCGR